MNVQDIKKILRENQSWAKKAYGQHFLVDEKVLDDIVRAADIQSTDRIIEIGPGFGVLTERLVKSAAEVIAIEADNLLADWLSKKYQISNIKNQNDKANIKIENQLTVIEGDALKVIDSLDFKEKYLAKNQNANLKNQNDKAKCKNRWQDNKQLGQILETKSYKVVANIPYSITSKLIRLFLENDYPPKAMTLLIQKEVAERIIAKPGDMSLLSLSVQLFGEAKIVRQVQPSSFWPEPKVNSSVIHIFFTGSVVDREQVGKIFRLARIGFSSRRKTLANNLAAGLQLERNKVVDIIKSVGLLETIRAQELSIDNWVKLVRKFDFDRQ